MYALMSVGYSLVYSIMSFSNFAHGGVIMVGAYVGFFALTALKVPFLVAFLLCGLGSGLLAVIIERLVYSPLRKRRAPSLYFIISAMGASIFLENFVIATIDGTPRNYPTLFSNSITLGSISRGVDSLLMIVVSAVSLLILMFIIQKTKIKVDEEGIEAAFDVENEVSDKVRSGVWVGDCFIYMNATSNKLCYCVGGQVFTVALLDLNRFKEFKTFA